MVTLSQQLEQSPVRMSGSKTTDTSEQNPVAQGKDGARRLVRVRSVLWLAETTPSGQLRWTLTLDRGRAGRGPHSEQTARKGGVPAGQGPMTSSHDDKQPR